MRILSIETSCDETSVAVVEKINDFQVQVLSDTTATSLAVHAQTGGIIPENAARAQVEYIIPVISRTLENASPNKNPIDFLKHEIDAIAVTYGPGLIGSLLVGVETAKTLAFSLRKPIVPVNHLLAHLYANFIANQTPHSSLNIQHFPCIGLIVSGGHTDLLYFRSHAEYQWLGGTRDDAAGECIDKSGRLLGLTYPAGPEIERRATQVTNPTIKFQSPLLHSTDFDFSFSGLKAEVARFVQKESMTNQLKNEVCYALQKAIFDVLIAKTLKAAEQFGVSHILLGGGVSANQTLLNQFRVKSSELGVSVFSPERTYSTDNGAMIGAYAALNYEPIPWQKITANPELYFA